MAKCKARNVAGGPPRVTRREVDGAIGVRYRATAEVVAREGGLMRSEGMETADLPGRYWGKAAPGYPGEPKWHLLIYHCLDVAAVGAVWWDRNPALQASFERAFPKSTAPAHLRAWMLFFVALHDLGKFDLRFQLKAPQAQAAAWRQMERDRDHGVSSDVIRHFDHGHAGMVWAWRELPDWTGSDGWQVSECWRNWLAAVTGHHGDYPDPGGEGIHTIEADDQIVEHDRAARRAWVMELEQLFLHPAGLSLRELPPDCSLPAQALLAGFCAVCDWIGSNAGEFEYRDPGEPLPEYFSKRCAQIESRKLLEGLGLFATSKSYAGVSALLGSGESPRGVQTEIDALPVTAGLTLIEAPTGSGKTEAALAHAWRLLDAGMADSIVFALPTQATADAMLARIQAFAGHAYGRANVVLAHGKRDLSKAFSELVERGQRPTAQGKVEASVQCADWLANSRKLVFLGQIGVCTVDQVLLSVLPVRHKFMRGFGLNKAVLIVDEVHAYDAYMYGLLGEVLKSQKASGGSAILLSATLPSGLRNKLLGAWDALGPQEAPYPAIWHTAGGTIEPRTVADAERPPCREVGVECLKLADAYPDDALLDRVIAAAESGALVGIVVNLVDDAQRLARDLRRRTAMEVDIFHARYRFTDRQRKEQAVREHYGREAPRGQGRILVATQVIEQSLDLDFDWLLTHICPVDLLFQRMGRLHRHARPTRPPGFEVPRCTVMTVAQQDYGTFELIYGNARVLWRTQQLLEQADSLIFPDVYRDWIERVYQREDWDAEPERIALAHDAFRSVQIGREKDAQRLCTMSVSSFRDEDDRVTGLTRDDEMSLSVLPFMADGRLLDGQRLEEIAASDLAEVVNLNVVPCPASWKNRLQDCAVQKEGPLASLRQLMMSELLSGVWRSRNGALTYTKDYGLEKSADESAR